MEHEYLQQIWSGSVLEGQSKGLQIYYVSYTGDQMKFLLVVYPAVRIHAHTVLCIVATKLYFL